MGWLIALGVVILLAVLPLGVSARYDEAGALVRILCGPVRMTLFPRKKRENPPKKAALPAPDGAEKEPQEKKRAPQPPVPPKKAADAAPAKGGSVLDFLPLVKTGLNFLGDLRRKLRIRVLELKVILAGGDPCDLAVNYGRAWAAVGNLLPQLERLFVIQKRDIEVQCDFTASETRIFARMDLTITLGRLLSLAVRYGLRVLKEFLAIQKKRKGGAVT